MQCLIQNHEKQRYRTMTTRNEGEGLDKDAYNNLTTHAEGELGPANTPDLEMAAPRLSIGFVPSSLSSRPVSNQRSAWNWTSSPTGAGARRSRRRKVGRLAS
jgi:hypothetical protein